MFMSAMDKVFSILSKHAAILDVFQDTFEIYSLH